MEFSIGDWTAIASTNELVKQGKSIKLEARAMDVLQLLHRHRGQVVSKDLLISSVWKLQVVSDHSITVVISNLRQALGDDPKNPIYIETIPKRGYRLIAADTAPYENGANSGLQQANGNTSAGHKKIAGRVAIAIGALLALIGIAWDVTRSPGARQPILVIRQVENATGDPTYDPLAETLSVLMLDNLSRQKDIRLIRWRHSSGRKAEDITTEMDGDTNILSGTLVAGEQGVWFATSLTNAETDQLYWSATQPVSKRHFRLAEVNTLKALSVQLGLQQTMVGRPVFSALAEELYWRARYLWSLRTHDSARRAQLLLQEVLEVEPDFGRAHAALADLYAHKTGSFFDGVIEDPRGKARFHLEQARKLAPGTLEVLLAAAHVALFIDGDAAAALEGLHMATGQAPNSVQAWTSYATALAATSQHDAAFAAISTAEALDPLDPSLRLDKVWTLFLARRFDDAVAAAAAAEDLGLSAALYRGFAFGATGRHAEAIAELSGHMVRVVGEEAADALAYKTMRAPSFLDAYRTMAEESRTRSPVLAAMLYALAGEKEKTRDIVNGFNGANANWAALWAHHTPVLENMFVETLDQRTVACPL